MEEEKKKDEQKTQQPEHGENWVTHLYDKANVSVKTLDIAAIVLIALIFIITFAFART